MTSRTSGRENSEENLAVGGKRQRPASLRREVVRKGEAGQSTPPPTKTGKEPEFPPLPPNAD